MRLSITPATACVAAIAGRGKAEAVIHVHAARGPPVPDRLDGVRARKCPVQMAATCSTSCSVLYALSRRASLSERSASRRCDAAGLDVRPVCSPPMHQASSACIKGRADVDRDHAAAGGPASQRRPVVPACAGRPCCTCYRTSQPNTRTAQRSWFHMTIQRCALGLFKAGVCR